MNNIFAILFLIFSVVVEAHYEVELVSVYDGDTIKVNVKGWPDIIGKKISVRVRGIDTPEIRGKCPYEKQLAIDARDAAIEFLNGSKLFISNIERGKYFRLVADVEVNGKSLSEHLLESGLAREYNGGRRLPWCN